MSSKVQAFKVSGFQFNFSAVEDEKSALSPGILD